MQFVERIVSFVDYILIVRFLALYLAHNSIKTY